MKRALIVCCILALTSCVALAQDVPGFQKTIADAQKLAKASGKPMYLHFTTTWCGWCRKMEKETYASEEGKKALADFVPATLDCTDANRQRLNLEMMHKYGGDGYPFILIITSDGAVLNSWAGYMQTDGFVRSLQKAGKVFEEYKKFQADTAKDDKTTYEYNSSAMAMYAKVQKWDSVLSCANAMVKLDPKMEKDQTLDAKFQALKATIKSGGGPDKVGAAYENVKKADPTNEKGCWEKAAMELMESQFQAKNYRAAVATVTGLTSRATKLTNGVDVWGRLAIVCAVGGDAKGADAALAKAAAVEGGDQAQLAKFKDRVEKIKSQPKK